MIEVEIIYDGDCPVCSAYVRMHRLREDGGAVHLVDAREHPDLVEAYASRGVDLNRDFVLKVDGVEYIGGAAMFALSSIAAPSRFLRRINAWLFTTRTTSRAIYAVLRVSRWALLLLMGRKPIRSSPLKQGNEQHA